MENYREYCNRLLGLPKNKKSILSEMRHTSLDSPILSPTAIPTPIIGGAVRGSVTGGLPSGADQAICPHICAIILFFVEMH